MFLSVQSTSTPVNDNLMEMMVMIDAAKRSPAKTYSTHSLFWLCKTGFQECKPLSITAKLVANLITTAGADRILTMDLHAGQISWIFLISSVDDYK